MGNSRTVTRWFGMAAPVAAAVALSAACSAGTVTTTDAKGAAPSRPPRTAGTLLVADPAGQAAADAIGRTVAVIPATTVAPTTTTAPVPVTVAPPTTVFTPVTTPRVTAAPPTTQGVVNTVSIPSGKPALVPMSAAALSADEQAIVGAINQKRAGSGLGGLTPEQHATDAARQHTAQMIAAGQPMNIDDVFGTVNAQYKSITQMTFNLPDSQDPSQFALSQYGAQMTGPFAWIGIGVTLSGGQRWVTVLLGA